MKHTHKIKLLTSAFSLLITHLFECACFLGWVEYTVGTIQNGECPKSDHRWRKAPGTTLPALSCAAHPTAAPYEWGHAWLRGRGSATASPFLLKPLSTCLAPYAKSTLSIELLCPAQVSHTGTCLQHATAGPGAANPKVSSPGSSQGPMVSSPTNGSDFAAQCSGFLQTKVEESKQWCVKGKPFIQTTLQTEIRVRPRYPRSQSSGQPQAGSWEAQFWPSATREAWLQAQKSENRRVLCPDCFMGWCDSSRHHAAFILSAWVILKQTTLGV